MDTTTTALVGAAGGVGTTRTALEVGATAARGGHDVVVLDAAYATQGIADHVDGRIDPDLTALVTDRTDDALDAGLHDVAVEDSDVTDVEAGRLEVAPARAPFERLARAKAPAAAETLEARIDEAADAADLVLVDSPPVASNQVVGVVTAVDHVVGVTTRTARGADALQRLRGRLQDVGSTLDGTLVVDRGDGERDRLDPDAVVPERSADPGAVPVAASDPAFAVALDDAAATVGAPVEIEPETEGLLDGDLVDLDSVSIAGE